MWRGRGWQEETSVPTAFLYLSLLPCFPFILIPWDLRQCPFSSPGSWVHPKGRNDIWVDASSFSTSFFPCSTTDALSLALVFLLPDPLSTPTSPWQTCLASGPCAVCEMGDLVFVCSVGFGLVYLKQFQVLALPPPPFKCQDSQCTPPCLDLKGISVSSGTQKTPQEPRQGLQTAKKEYH